MIAQPRKPPMNEPTTPSKIVAARPMGSRPGTSKRAREARDCANNDHAVVYGNVFKRFRWGMHGHGSIRATQEASTGCTELQAQRRGLVLGLIGSLPIGAVGHWA